MDDFEQAFKNAFKEIGRVNLAVFGKTGVGKSTLINSFFGVDVAGTGIGRPITTDTTYYTVPSSPLGLYDSKGFEVGDASDELLRQMQKIVEDSRHLADISQHVHAVWYCVRSSDRRFEETQRDFVVKLLDLDLPVIIVMTQVPARDGQVDPEAEILRESIVAEFKDALRHPARVVFTNAKRNDFLGLDVHGMTELLDATVAVVPEAVKKALYAAQRVDMNRKRDEARNYIAAASAAAAAIAVTPIPLSDSVLLVPVQIGMIARITAIYGLSLPARVGVSLATTAIMGQGVGVAARSLAKTLLKYVPGVNLAVMGIQASVAASVTAAVGGAWMVVCEQLLTRDPAALAELVDSPEVVSMFREAFQQRLRPAE